jgi:hypothetical protein
LPWPVARVQSELKAKPLILLSQNGLTSW